MYLQYISNFFSK